MCEVTGAALSDRGYDTLGGSNMRVLTYQVSSLYQNVLYFNDQTKQETKHLIMFGKL